MRTPFVSDVSRETLNRYALLIERWNRKINLVASASLEEIRTRHIEDSLRVVDAIPESTRSVLDLGSGGGLPGLVVAICRTDLTVKLIEADARKSAFLQSARRELGVRCSVIRSRIEEHPPEAADVITARALAPLPHLLQLAVRHARSDTVYIFPKGERWREEVDEARLRWNFEMTLQQEGEPGRGPILILSNVEARS